MARYSHVDDSFIQLQLKVLSSWHSEDPQITLDIRVLRNAILQNLSQNERLEIVHRILDRQEQLLKSALGAKYELINSVRQNQFGKPLGA
ncbi:hypothetical protein [Rheinheimera texasensis]|uniref:hypothetical protein n=1 Tax=Rheinheimera texasensis TaxID=306205 RepID=UPI0004E1DF26|nr:hypothetical protein [Rheinheimera texasensis]